MNENIIETIEWYKQEVFNEMENRGYGKEDIPNIIAKTGFLRALNEYPEQQLHDSIQDAVDEIIFVAAAAQIFRCRSFFSESGYGDGGYPVYAHLNKTGIPDALEIRFA